MFKGKILKGYEWGSGDKTILLVHGWESRGTALRSFVPKLMNQGYKVVAFDGPAHGNSSGRTTNLVDFGGAIKAIINQVGGVYGIIAHSFGGSSTVYSLSSLGQTQKLEKLILVASMLNVKTASSNFLDLIKAPSNVRIELEKKLEQILKKPLDEIDVRKMKSDAMINEVLIVHDKKDDIIPFSSSQKIVDSWEGAKFIVTEGLGHYQLLKHDLVIEKVIDFINN